MNARPNSPPSAVRLTRSQMTKQEEELGVEWDPLVGYQVQQPEAAPTSLHETEDLSEPATHVAFAEPPSPLPSAMPNVIKSLRKDTPGKRSTSNKENIEPMETSTPIPAAFASLTPRSNRRSPTYDALEAAAVHAATPPALSREPSRTEFPLQQPSMEPIHEPPMSSPQCADAPMSPSSKLEDPIVAMDALEEAVEKVAAEVPHLPASPMKPKSRKAGPVVRTTKASQARMSLAQNDKNGISKAPATGHPRPSAALGRAGSIRHSVATKSELASKRVPSTSSRKQAEAQPANREKKETVIPHSKPRPVSISFPTPPPPPKSKKAPTTAAFQLPGEAVAAKLKAAREERTKKEPEEGQKKPAFKARPVPTTLNKAPSVRQTSASKARESLMGGKPAGSLTVHKRTQSAVTPGTSTFKSKTGSKETSARSTSSSKPAPEALKVAKRASTAMANISKPRTSLANNTGAVPAATAAASCATIQQRVPSKGTTKGKEVFNRAAAAKGAAEKEKREKEDAAKKARAAASERGRVASREWAEKQKMKKLGVKAEAKAAPAPEVQTTEATEVTVSGMNSTVLGASEGEVATNA